MGEIFRPPVELQFQLGLQETGDLPECQTL